MTFIKKFEKSVKECWQMPAINDYREDAMTYGELASSIFRLQRIWEAAGIAKGDRIAINAPASANWGVVFMAAVTGGQVPCQMINGILPQDTVNLVNHSGSRLRYTEERVFRQINPEDMPQVIAILDARSGALLYSKPEFASAYSEGMAADCVLYPENLAYDDRPEDDICSTMYTSGSTGTPKGVMLSVRNFSANVDVIPEVLPYHRGDSYLSILPYAHIFGLTFDLITPLCTGMHVVPLCMPPVPKILSEALCNVNPHIVVMVPLVLTKMKDELIGEFVNSRSGKARLAAVSENRAFARALRTIFMSALGDNVELIITGGSAIPEALESLLIDIDVPVVTGYGMTECAPLITLGEYGDYRKKECGKPIRTIDLRIASEDPQNVPGEVQVQGPVVFGGYYRNPEADSRAFTPDGWFRTGDMGILRDGHLFLVGRCKSMLLTTNGQNVFPEEIELVLNQLPYVSESLIVQRGNRFIALIVPDSDAVANDDLDAATLATMMETNLTTLNRKIPAYAAVSGYELVSGQFSKTPKGSIKRFLYA